MERVLNLKKGDKCCVAIIKGSNASKYKDMSLENIDNWTYEGEVISCGKKYITVKFGIKDEKFVIEDDYRNKYNCGGADWQLFESKQEVIDNEKREHLLYDLFGLKCNRKAIINNLSLDQLERIQDIIEEEN